MKRLVRPLVLATVISVPFLLQYACSNALGAGKTRQTETNRQSNKVVPPASSSGSVLLHTDFNASSWTEASARASSRAATATVTNAPAGTVDTAATSQASSALFLTAKPTAGNATDWTASLTSGLLPVRNRETRLGKITLGFMLSASNNKPVTVRVQSFDKNKKLTGSLLGTIFPAAPDFFQRYALDLDTLKNDGAGKFDPTAPFVQFSFAGTGTTNAEYQMRLDNVSYATPAFYVSPQGSDNNDGKSETRALATVQKALDLAQPGDIVVLMDGTFRGGNAPVASFRRGGTPDAWIVLKNYPGAKPTLTSTGWNIVSIADGSKEKPSDLPALAYLEVRGLHVRGEGDVAKAKYPEAMNKGDSRTNSNGIAIDGRFMRNIPHHIRLADNIVEFCPGQGLGSIEGDWITIENNISRSNCWTTIYATSGISVMGFVNFDGLDNVYKRLIRNNTCYRNETFEIWEAVKHPSDGNGIILDVNAGPDPHAKTTFHTASRYAGRTLVQSNVSFDNGGSGIHTVSANRVDIVGNTCYLNSASKSLEYSQIFSYGSEDVRIMNNILVAPVADVTSGAKPEPVNRLGGKNTDVVFSHNLYFGGNIAPTLGEGDAIGDPRFVRASRDGSVSDFHLEADSPAVGKGMSLPFAPLLDRDGKVRKSLPSLGAFEK